MAQKQRQIATDEQKGKERFETFKSVIARYKDAMAAGFYLEAITLMESIIGDRLECYLHRNIESVDYSFSTLGRLIEGLKKVDSTSPLVNKITKWKNQRNALLHEMAKIEDGKYVDFAAKYNIAKQCAEEGLALFREIDKLCMK